MNIKKISFINFFLLIFITILTIIIFPHIVDRFMNVALSSMSVNYICQNSDITTFTYYFEVFYNFINDIPNKPMIKYFFYENAFFADGYTLSPTVFSEIGCLYSNYGLVIFIVSSLFIILSVVAFYLFFMLISKEKLFFLIIVLSGLLSNTMDLYNLLLYGLFSKIIILPFLKNKN